MSLSMVNICQEKSTSISTNLWARHIATYEGSTVTLACESVVVSGTNLTIVWDMTLLSLPLLFFDFPSPPDDLIDGLN